MAKIKTKIIATIGPASLDFDIFKRIIEAGVDFVRINTSYGDEQQYQTIFDNLKKLNLEIKTKTILDVKSLEKLDYALRYGIDFIALSFAEEAAQIENIRRQLPTSFVISKIESEKGVKNFDTILEASDGIMVARGDLGRAVSLEKVPPLQKEFTKKTTEHGKFLVTATEMLLSMVINPQPTRAEVSDVANAVFEQSSAVMLSEETAIGKYPVESVIIMQKIIKEAEAWLDKNTVA